MVERLIASVLKTEGPTGPGGSNPSSSATICAISSAVERFLDVERAGSSILSSRTKFQTSGDPHRKSICREPVTGETWVVVSGKMVSEFNASVA